ncbi:septum formation protein Maf [Antarcticibacterium arcticum]|uniref:dTTP/UTP pyrophosphatase n=1 Tax=Antarcticibacterium arcticum TaxID=2585771 RepID=A0A5B8YJ10_9FLAO|nr:Maf-like protein [Antarcticibacterium arcticum]QED36827.1 septum formation protein Maf [Antarcticibacterium arcticum]
MLKEKLKEYRIILASGSPRRHQFLQEMGIPFTIDLRPVKEVYPTHLKASEITNYLSELKAEVFLKELKEKDILITSDTIVWHNDKALGKPERTAEAIEMLESLSGTTHKVITSVSFTTSRSQKTVHSTTGVTFKKLNREEIEYYIENYRPFDKAGAYGIQEWIGLIGITRVEGSYFNVVGLPTHMVYKSLLEIASR